DFSGAWGAFYPISGQGVSVTNWTFSNNVDMNSGRTIAADNSLGGTPSPSTPRAPTIASFTTDSGTVGDHITNDSTLTLSGTAAANSTVKIFDGATLLNSVTANDSGAWTFTTGTLANGAHNFTATATNSSGTSPSSSALSVTIDTVAPVAPTITSFSPDTGTVGDGNTTANVLTLTGTAEANSTVKIFDGATLLNSVTANASGAWTYTTGALANGTHSLTATTAHASCKTGAAA